MILPQPRLEWIRLQLLLYVNAFESRLMGVGSVFVGTFDLRCSRILYTPGQGGLGIDDGRLTVRISWLGGRLSEG